ncbi:MAG: peptide deformylase [Planctomycetota bacterium]|nr:peptide deformylase [Planctomycetota bacterium]
MEILKYPDPFLRTRTKKLEDITDGVIEKVREMFDTMYKAHGVGLAATQIGWDARVFVKNITGKPEGEEVHINPVIVEKSGDYADEEGCLSLPSLRGKIERSEEVLLRSTGIDGKPQEVRHKNLAARAVQHEIDHLDGMLFIHRLRPADRVLMRGALRDLERQFKSRSDQGSLR